MFYKEKLVVILKQVLYCTWYFAQEIGNIWKTEEIERRLLFSNKISWIVASSESYMLETLLFFILLPKNLLSKVQKYKNVHY